MNSMFWVSLGSQLRPLVMATGIMLTAGGVASAMTDAEKQEAMAKEAAAIEALLTEVPDTVRGAREPADLDVLIERLMVANRKGYGPDPAFPRDTLIKVGSILDLVSRWQDYLAAVKSDRPAEALLVLDNMKSIGRLEMLMPRSRILELMDKMGGPGEGLRIVMEIRSLDQVGSTIARLQKIRLDGYPISREIGGYIVKLSEIEQSYRDYKNGLPFSLRYKNDHWDVASKQILSKIIELRSQMLLLSLPAYVGAPPATKAREGEAASEFLERVEREARERQDVAVVVECRRVRAFFRAWGDPSSLDEAGAQHLVAARNQEQAGQYDFAVVSYQMALRQGGDLVPADWVGSRLKAIEAEHPEKFREGMGRIANPRLAK